MKDLAAPENAITFIAQDVVDGGGMERAVRHLAAGLLDRGWRVSVIARTCDLPRHERMNFIPVRGPRRPFPLGYPWFWVAAARQCSRHARGLVHGVGANVPQSLDVITVQYVHRAAASRRIERHLGASLPHRVSGGAAQALSEAGERWVMRPSRARRVVAVSLGIADEVQRLYPGVAGRVRVIPNGVNTDRFRPDAKRRRGARQSLGVADDTLLAIFLGGDWGRKGLRHAVEAVGLTDAWELLVVGPGDPAPYADHRSGRVHFLGPSAEPERWLAAADALVLPTAYEAFSLVTIEAAASGLPLLVSATNGVDEILRNGTNGWVIERNPRDIAQRLELLRNPAARTRMGQASLARARELSWEAAVDAYTDLYSELLP